MTKTRTEVNHSFKVIKIICISLVIITIGFVGNIFNKRSDLRKSLIGTWNIEFENCTWERSCDYDFLTGSLLIEDNDSAFFPIIDDTINQIDYCGKNAWELGDDFYTEEIIDKNVKNLQRIMKNAQGVWRFTNRKGDSIFFDVPNSPFHGKYAVSFFLDSVSRDGSPYNVKYLYKMKLVNDSTYLLFNKNEGISNVFN